ncbi:MAG: hypothetical protein HZB43_12205 [candidate division Zixibacteria bacterium]|nr:hypothetical protein [candidate division Zixibacteria bacterium]
MNSTYSQLTSRRAWYVPGLSITGDLQTQTVDAIGTEVDAAETRVVFYRFSFGGQAQELSYAGMTDHRGNHLPAAIDHPVVIIIPRNAIGVVLVGRPGNAACRLAKTSASGEDGLVDLWITEAGA